MATFNTSPGAPAPPQLQSSDAVYLELPPEPIIQALGTNYNAMIRTWTLRQYQLHLEHHQKMCNYYQQCISRLQDLEVRYENEPETPVAPVGGQGPIKLSDLAKMRPQQPIHNKPASASVAQGPSGNIKSFDGKGGNTLSSSLAAKEVKLDKKPKPINVNVEMDEEERESLQEPELQHFSRPQPARKNNKRTDLAALKDEKSDDEVSTWQENPNAFGPNGEKKESKIKSAFGGLKSSLFSKEKDEPPQPQVKSSVVSPSALVGQNYSSQPSSSYNANNSSNPVSPPPTYPQPPATPTYLSNNGNNPYSSGVPPPIPGGPPPLTIPTNEPSPSGGPPRLNIPPPPATPTFSPR